MEKLPCIKSDSTYYLLLKDYQDFFNGWVVLIITKNDIFTKADERIIGDAKMAKEKFKELYSYKAEFSYKTLKEIV
jgi:hypothetical protein